MKFTWVDYPAQFEEEIEGWCDEYAAAFALDCDSVKMEHQWYLNADRTLNHDYFNKIILEDGTPIALLMMAINEEERREKLTENVIHLDTLIINPLYRNKGYGARILTDILEHAEEIIGRDNNVFLGQIHKDNTISIKLMHKLGFESVAFLDETQDDWGNWVYPPSAAENIRSYYRTFPV